MTMGIAPPRAERTWSLFGLRLRSAHVFENRLTPDRGQPDLRFAYVDHDPIAPGWEGLAPAYASPNLVDDDQPWLAVFRTPACTVLHFGGVATFFLFDDRIACRVLDPAYAYMVELHLLGYVLSLWLELRGVLMLHAAAVEVDAHAVGFLATNKGGKTSLAASLMQLGHPLVSDDIVPLETELGGAVARPGYPQMRMWPDQAALFAGPIERLETVHPRLEKRRVPTGPGAFGTFTQAERLPLACLYLPQRVVGAPIEIAALSTATSLVTATEHSFAVGIVEGLGLEVERFGRLAHLIRHVPIRRLTYPDGVEHLPAVRSAVLEDVRRLLEAARGVDAR